MENFDCVTRNFDTLIALKPKATVKSYYSDRLYKTEDFCDPRVMAVLEDEYYTFRFMGSTFGVLATDVRIIAR